MQYTLSLERSNLLVKGRGGAREAVARRTSHPAGRAAHSLNSVLCDWPRGHILTVPRDCMFDAVVTAVF